MVISRSEMLSENREKPRNGTGTVTFVHYIEGKGAVQKNTNMLAELTLPPGASIGYHSHTGETELYLVVEGSGVVSDNGKEVPVRAGDAMVTGNGDSHSLANNGTVPLKVIAAIIQG